MSDLPLGSLVSLPLEIFEHVANFCWQADRLSLALVHSALRAPAQRVLLTIVRLPDGDCSIELLLFMRTILERPALGKWVRELYVGRSIGCSSAYVPVDPQADLSRRIAIAHTFDRTLPHLTALHVLSILWNLQQLSEIQFVNAPTKLVCLTITRCTPPLNAWLEQCSDLRYLTFVERPHSRFFGSSRRTPPPNFALPLVPTGSMNRLKSLCSSVHGLAAVVPGRNVEVIAMGYAATCDVIAEARFFESVALSMAPLRKLYIHVYLDASATFLTDWDDFRLIGQDHMNSLVSLTLYLTPRIREPRYHSRIRAFLQELLPLELVKLEKLRVWYPADVPVTSRSILPKETMALDEQLAYLSHSFLPTLQQVSLCSQVVWFRVPNDDRLQGAHTVHSINGPDTRRALWVSKPCGLHRAVIEEWLESVEQRNPQGSPSELSAIPRAAVDWVRTCNIADDDSILDELDEIPTDDAEFQEDDSWSVDIRDSDGSSSSSTSSSNVDAAYVSDAEQGSDSNWHSDEEYASISDDELRELMDERDELGVEGKGEPPSSLDITREDWETMMADRRRVLGTDYNNAPRNTCFQSRHGGVVDRLLEELDLYRSPAGTFEL